jgi:hypothetical protein
MKQPDSETNVLSGALVLICFILLFLKLIGVSGISWWMITMPLWLGLIIVVPMAMLALVVIGIVMVCLWFWEEFGPASRR